MSLSIVIRANIGLLKFLQVKIGGPGPGGLPLNPPLNLDS